MNYDKTIIRDSAFHILLENTSDLVFVKDKNLVYVASSLPFAKMAGKKSVEEILGKTDFEIFEDCELAKRYTDDDRKLLAGGKNLVDYIEPLTDEQGKPRYSATSKFILRDENGEIEGILGISKDITREYTAQQDHQKALKYMFELPEDIYSAVFIDIDDWRIVTQRKQEINGFIMPTHQTIDELVDNAIRSIPDDESVRSFFCNFSQEALQSIYNSGQRSLSMSYSRSIREGASRWIQLEATFLTDPASGHLCCMFFIRDIDEMKHEEINLIQAANMDQMTGLLNRASTMSRIERFLARGGKGGTHALFMIDVDNFKSLNDTFGHQAGDDFLISIAKSIKSCFRATDIVGRIGGDEFFALMKNIPNMTALNIKANDLLNAMQSVCSVCNIQSSAYLSGSIGISIYGVDGNTLDELYAQADEAMYKAKKFGKNRYAFASEVNER